MIFNGLTFRLTIFFYHGDTKRLRDKNPVIFVLKTILVRRDVGPGSFQFIQPFQQFMPPPIANGACCFYLASEFKNN